jgi:hypothetical protein
MDKMIRGRFIRNPKICDLSPEIVRMGANSVEAAVLARNDHRQHLALPTTKRRTAKHKRAIESH